MPFSTINSNNRRTSFGIGILSWKTDPDAERSRFKESDAKGGHYVNRRFHAHRRSTIWVRFSLNASIHSSTVANPDETSPGDWSRNCTRATSNRSRIW
jgi:hypothetical protein